MLTFFRKLRIGLLDSGHVKRYTFYALGEIALVVIGILIALQISNWNENRIQQNKLKLQIASLCEDLKRDSVHLIQLIDSYDQKIRILKGMEDCYDSIMASPSQEDCIVNILFASSSFINLKNNDKAINQLKNSGGMDILDTPDANLILDYELLMIEYKMDEHTVFQVTQTSLRGLAAQFMSFRSYKDGKRDPEEPLTMQDDRLLNEYFNILRRYLLYSESSSRLLKIIQEKNAQIRDHFTKKFKLFD